MLVIHPKDPSTDFLKSLYEGRTDVRLIDEIGSVKELRHALNHVGPGETVMLLGHGCPNGLYALDEIHSPLTEYNYKSIYTVGYNR